MPTMRRVEHTENDHWGAVLPQKLMRNRASGLTTGHKRLTFVHAIFIDELVSKRCHKSNVFLLFFLAGCTELLKNLGNWIRNTGGQCFTSDIKYTQYTKYPSEHSAGQFIKVALQTVVNMYPTHSPSPLVLIS